MRVCIHVDTDARDTVRWSAHFVFRKRVPDGHMRVRFSQLVGFANNKLAYGTVRFYLHPTQKHTYFVRLADIFKY